MHVYITDLAAYNQGHLVGEWVELPLREEELSQKVAHILKEGQEVCSGTQIHEEYFITDFECDIMEIDEYASLDQLNDLAEQLMELDDQQKTAVKILLEANIVNSHP
jgi:antirestriction protein